MMTPTEIREALTWDLDYVFAIRKGDPKATLEPFSVIVEAARAYADLLDSGQEADR